MATQEEVKKWTGFTSIKMGDENIRFDRPLIFGLPNEMKIVIEVTGTGLTYGNWVIVESKRYLLSRLSIRRYASIEREEDENLRLSAA